MYELKRKKENYNVAFLLNRNVIKSGEPAQVFSSPQDARTLDFIEGKMIYQEDSNV